MEIAFLFDGPEDAATTLALAHGAGAPMDHPFMNFFATTLADRGLRVARFEFPYMAARRRGGNKRPPDRAPVLLDCWAAAIAQLAGPGRLVIGGKSMGGRIASMIAAGEDPAANQVAGVVCLGYPFYPPGRPEKTRTAHLEALATPTLIVQGERDPMGARPVVGAYRLSPAITIHWLADGDHGFKPRKKSGHTEAENWTRAVEHIVAFVAEI